MSTKPPPVLRLSDGGHFENLALLPLLEKKLDRIVVVDGSCNPGGEKYADALLHAIKKARETLHCSFTPLTNDEGTEGGGTRDIEEDIRVRFLTKKNGRLPRHYRFKVHYYDVIDVNGVSVDILGTLRFEDGVLKSNVVAYRGLGRARRSRRGNFDLRSSA